MEPAMALAGLVGDLERSQWARPDHVMAAQFRHLG